MFSRLLILFIVVPMIELMLLIEVGKLIGFWPTLGLICFTGLIGSALARQEGLSVWTRFNSRMQQGQLPGTELIDGLIILVSGALLLTPGIITDIVGFLGLFPLSRRLIRSYAQKRLKTAQSNGSIKFSTGNPFGQWSSPAPPPADTEPTWQGTPKERPESDD